MNNVKQLNDIRLPLDGIKVIDFSAFIAGPTASDILGSLGASVYKIEGPSGDAMRNARSIGLSHEHPSPSFMAYNRFKKSLCIDLKSDGGRAAVYQILKQADVMIDGARPGTMDRLGFGYTDVQKQNPKIIYAALSAFGQSGPFASRAGFDIAIQAESGIMSITGERDGAPMKVGAPVIDVASGYALVQGILAGLYARQSTGKGDYVSVAMIDVAVHLQSQMFAEFLESGRPPVRPGNSAPYVAPADCFTTADGSIVISAYMPTHWKKFCEVIGRIDLIVDQRFINVADRVKNRRELIMIIESVLSEATTDEWMDRLLAAGLVAGKVANYHDVVSSEQLAANSSIVTWRSFDGGEFKTVRPPVRYGRDGIENRQGVVPSLGLNSIEMLKEFGLDEREIQNLLKNKIVFNHDVK
jgi:crotonobetainyl-CoA:carnitine CoA-transferase CaiB-like acyl-CoA transferase